MENGTVELRKTKTRNQTVSPSTKVQDDKWETDTTDNHFENEVCKDDFINYQNSRAFKADHFNTQKKVQREKQKSKQGGKPAGFLNFLGC